MSQTAKILPHPSMTKRAFEAAHVHPALSKWIAAAVPTDVDIHNALRVLRARSRESAQNDDHMRLFLRLVETNVVGRQGVSIQSKARRTSGKLDASLARRIDDDWEAQSERGTWDMSGQHSRNGFDRLLVRVAAQDGEGLVRIHEGHPDAPSGFAVEMLDAEALDIDYNEALKNGNTVRMGVEMTPYRRPVAYWFFREQQHPLSSYSRSDRIRVPAADIVHLYLPEWACQTRGIPWGSTALKRMKMLSGYEEAAITAARGAAVKSSQYVSESWADPSMTPAGEQTSSGIVQNLTPGGVEIPPWGTRLEPIDWNWPNTDHGAFVKEALRGVTAGLGVSYNIGANDLEGVNFSSLRQGALSDRDLWMMLQEWLIDWSVRPIRNRWLAWRINSGRLTQTNGKSLDLSQIRRMSHSSYQGRRWQWVDPLKDLKAAEAGVNLRVRSVSDVIREQGRDPAVVWDELRSDKETLESMGLAWVPTSIEFPDDPDS